MGFATQVTVYRSVAIQVLESAYRQISNGKEMFSTFALEYF